MNEILKENLGKVFDLGWEKEIKPLLETKYKNQEKKVWDDSSPTLSIKHAALLLNTSIRALKSFLIEEGFLSKTGWPDEESVTREHLTLETRNFSKERVDIPIVKFTREGFIEIGSQFLILRNSKSF